MPINNFDAGDLDEITYDFTKYVKGAVGVIPEPTSDQLDTFLAVIRQTMPTKEVDGKTVLDTEKIQAAFEDGTISEEVVIQAVSDVCSGTPTAQQINALPFRLKRRFIGWITGVLLDPEA